VNALLTIQAHRLRVSTHTEVSLQVNLVSGGQKTGTGLQEFGFKFSVGGSVPVIFMIVSVCHVLSKCP
jgi:hypothetical protein